MKLSMFNGQIFIKVDFDSAQFYALDELLFFKKKIISIATQ